MDETTLPIRSQDISRPEMGTVINGNSGPAPRVMIEPQLSDAQRAMRAVWRRKWLVLGVTLLGTIGGVFLARVLGPRYTARTVLWVESTARDHTRDLVVDETTVPSGSWTDVVTSSTVIDTVVINRRLFLRSKEPADSALFTGFAVKSGLIPGRYRLAVEPGSITLRRSDGTTIQTAKAGDSIGTAVGFSWIPPASILRPGRVVDFEVVSPYHAAEDLITALRVRQDPGGGFLSIELRERDPAAAASIVNAIADRVVRVGSDLKRHKYEELARILGDRYDEARQQLRAAEAALQRHRVETAEVRSPANDAGHSDPAFSRTFDLRVAIEQVGRDRKTLERALGAEPGTRPSIEALASVPAVEQSPDLRTALDEATTKNAELRALRNRYTPTSAPVRQAQAELDALELRTIPELAHVLMGELNIREGQLQQQLQGMVAGLKAAPPVAIEDGRLSRDVATAEALANSVGQRYEAARLAMASSLPDARILDRAVAPERPSLSFVPLVVALALVASLALGVIGVTAADRVNPKVNHPGQIVEQMGLPILAALPRVRIRSGPRSRQSAEMIEAIRTLRIRVLHGMDPVGGRVLTVTSPAAGDGKSFVSVNLALSFAHAGYRTLLIDGDVRRGNQHTVLGGAVSPGLTDLLLGQSTIDQAISPTSYQNLSFLGSGTRLHRAPELLLLPALQDLVAQARNRFSIVIIDSPPLAAGVDPLVLGTTTGNVLLVLRAEKTDMSLALAKLEVADALPLRTIGAVLNCVGGSGAFRSYTYDLSGYDEPEPGAVRKSEGWSQILEGRPA